MPRRVFVGFSEVANYYTGLCEGFSEIGVEYIFISWGKNIRNYDLESNVNFEQKVIHRLTGWMDKSRFLYFLFYPIFIIVRFYLFLKYFVLCDVFLFSYNSSFLFGLDLPMYRIFRKKVFCIYHGSDNRPPYMSGNYVYEGWSADRVFQLTRKMYKRAKWRERFACGIISLPATAAFFSSELIHFLWLGLPVPKRPDAVAGEKGSTRGKFRVVHAPSTRKPKGTFLIREFMEQLILKYPFVEYVELFGVDNASVLDELSKADLVLDEMFSDTTMAGLATEAASYGVASLVGGYHQDMGEFIRSDMIPPAFYVHPSKFAVELERLINDPEAVKLKGQEAQRFVRDRFNPGAVAARFIALCDDNAPKAARFDAGSLTNYFGWGTPEFELKSFLRDYISQYGTKGLFLDHNKKLRKIIDREVRFGADN